MNIHYSLNKIVDDLILKKPLKMSRYKNLFYIIIYPITYLPLINISLSESTLAREFSLKDPVFLLVFALVCRDMLLHVLGRILEPKISGSLVERSKVPSGMPRNSESIVYEAI